MKSRTEGPYWELLGKLEKLQSRAAKGLTDNQAALANYGFDPIKGKPHKGWLDRSSENYFAWARKNLPEIPDPDSPEFEEFIKEDEEDEPLRLRVAIVYSHLVGAYKYWRYKQRVVDQEFDAARATRLLLRYRKSQIVMRTERLTRLEAINAPVVIINNARALVSKAERDGGLTITYPVELAEYDKEERSSL